MSDSVAVYRVTGDKLELTFSSDGSLSAAKFNAADISLNAVRMLRASDYMYTLEMQGFTPEVPAHVTSRWREINERLKKTHNLHVIAIRESRHDAGMFDVRLGEGESVPFSATKMIAVYDPRCRLFSQLLVSLNDPDGFWGVAKLNQAL